MSTFTNFSFNTIRCCFFDRQATLRLIVASCLFFIKKKKKIEDSSFFLSHSPLRCMCAVLQIFDNDANVIINLREKYFDDDANDNEDFSARTLGANVKKCPRQYDE